MEELTILRQSEKCWPRDYVPRSQNAGVFSITPLLLDLKSRSSLSFHNKYRLRRRRKRRRKEEKKKTKKKEEEKKNEEEEEEKKKKKEKKKKEKKEEEEENEEEERKKKEKEKKKKKKKKEKKKKKKQRGHSSDVECLSLQSNSFKYGVTETRRPIA
jgi:flagellar biosynthesis GTPase FlhF